MTILFDKQTVFAPLSSLLHSYSDFLEEKATALRSAHGPFVPHATRTNTRAAQPSRDSPQTVSFGEIGAQSRPVRRQRPRRSFLFGSLFEASGVRPRHRIEFGHRS